MLMEIIFTEHAKDRMKKRKISREEIIEIIKYPDKVIKKFGKYIVQKNLQRANIEVVYEKEKYLKIITVYYI